MKVTLQTVHLVESEVKKKEEKLPNENWGKARWWAPSFCATHSFLQPLFPFLTLQTKDERLNAHYRLMMVTMVLYHPNKPPFPGISPGENNSTQPPTPPPPQNPTVYVSLCSERNVREN